MKRRAIIVDVDGTVADMNKGQEGARQPWDWHRVGEDLPHWDVITLVRMLEAAGHAVIFVSGRDERCRAVTAEWLDIFVHVEYHPHRHDGTETRLYLATETHRLSCL